MSNSTNDFKKCSRPRVKNDSSFLVRIVFRKGANWQGEVHWLETDQKKRFRSSMELMMLMQEAMDETNTPEAEFSFRTWDDDNEEELFWRNLK